MPRTIPSHQKTASEPAIVGNGRRQSYAKEIVLPSSVLPTTIQEVSEPSTPSQTRPASPHTSNFTPTISNITNLLRSQSTSPVNSRDQLKVDESAIIVDDDAEDAQREITPDTVAGADERTPLLQQQAKQDLIQEPNGDHVRVDGDIERQVERRRKPNHLTQLTTEFRHKTTEVVHVVLTPKSWSWEAVWQHGIKHPFSLLPCVFLGVLLNVLDGLSYGMYTPLLALYHEANNR